MKKNICSWVCALIAQLIIVQVNAQAYDCPSPLIFIRPSTTQQSISVLNPNFPLSATNPSITNIPIPSGALAFLPNINGSTVSPTFYAIIGVTYHYWDNTTWVNTGHTRGNGAANIGGCAGRIYNLGTNGIMYTYNGASNDASLCIVPNSVVADVVTDCSCNFFVLNPKVPDQALIKYSPLGVMQASYALNGLPTSIGGGGFAIANNNVYFPFNGQLYTGPITGTVINFSATPVPTNNPLDASDWAACPTDVPTFGSPSLTISQSTACASGTVQVSAGTAGSYSWQPFGSGQSFIYTTTTSNVFTLTAADSLGCSSQNTIAVTTHSLPLIGVSGKTLVCKGDKVLLNASGANTYTWNTLQGVSTYSAIADTNVVLNLSGTNTLTGCKSTSTFTLTIKLCTGISEDLSPGEVLRIYPNPVQDKIRFLNATAVKFMLFDYAGIKIGTLVTDANSEVDVSALKPGLYFFVAENSTNAVLKFFKE